ncbi:MAG: hypothetical protein K6T34_10140 [Thermoflavifilum sp.]|nr:hypothetical protein [Thermoflavifilum sp.]
MDMQTLYDLDIFSRDPDHHSVYGFVQDFTLTTGGKEALQRRMLHPITEYTQLVEAQQTVKFLKDHIDLWRNTFHAQEIKYLEEYFHSNIMPLDGDIASSFSLRIWLYRLRYGPDYDFISNSIYRLARFIQQLYEFVHLYARESPAAVFTELKRVIEAIFAEDTRRRLHAATSFPIKPHEIFYLDHFIRADHRSAFESILNAFYELDALFAFAQATATYHLVMPEINQPGGPLDIKGLYHLFLPHAVRNDVYFDATKAFIFLTGPNMAGKSTFLKACGIAVYLAHLGMGVPASSATIPVFDGIFTDIYITDQVEKGYSYFFNEVRRIQELASHLQAGKRLFIMIDEMFRGTNVQDAYDCSLAVIEKLLPYRNSYIVLASHLTELAHALQPSTAIRFYYFEAAVQDQQPVFSYQMKPGISEVRLGRLILQRQGILELLEKGRTPQDS